MSAGEPWTTCRIDLPTGPVAFLRAGPEGAPPVLLLHGGGVDRASFSYRSLIPQLSDRFAVVAPDWPGYGDTPGVGNGPITVAVLGRWLVSLLDALAMPPADVVGISMGGGAALWLAVNQPARVRRLALVAPYGIMPRMAHHRLVHAFSRLPLTSVVGWLMCRSRFATRQALAVAVKAPVTNLDSLAAEMQSAARAAGGMRTFARFQSGEVLTDRFATDFSPHLTDVHHETLILHGAMDKLIPLAYARAAVARMPNASLCVLPTGHLALREAPDAFNDAIGAFLL